MTRDLKNVVRVFIRDHATVCLQVEYATLTFDAYTPADAARIAARVAETLGVEVEKP